MSTPRDDALDTEEYGATSQQRSDSEAEYEEDIEQHMQRAIEERNEATPSRSSRFCLLISDRRSSS